jgi:tetratricopeptide (TPR) repeat protein
VDDLVRIANALGISGEVEDDGTLWWQEELSLGSTAVPCVFQASARDDQVVLGLGCQILDGDSDRFDAVVLESPLRGLDIEIGEADDAGDPPEEDDDPPIWVVAEAAFPAGEGTVGLEAARDATRALVVALAETGVIDIVDATDVDPSIVPDARRLLGLKRQRPRDALDLALDLADRSRVAGDFIRAATFDLAAADVACELGEPTRCWELTEPAWSVLGKPLGDAEVASAYAKALHAIGRQDEGISVLELAEGAASDRNGALLARGNRGVLLAASGRFSEAIDLLQSVVDDESLAEHGVVLRAQLAEARRSIGAAAGPEPLELMDVIDGANEDINDALALLISMSSPSQLDELVPEIEETVARVRGRWDLLGPAQRIRVVMVEGNLAVMKGDPIEAARRYRVAVQMATDAGDTELAQWATSMHRSVTPSPQADGPGPDRSARERLTFAFNTALRQLHELIRAGVDPPPPGAAEEALRSALDAVRAADRCRHEFAEISDRRAWAHMAERTYELALGVAVVLDRRSLVVELLERMRAQGVPAASEGPALESTSRQASVGALPVDAPVVATVSGASEIDVDDAALALDVVVTAVSGRGAWWWSCRTVGRRVYWAVREPDGSLHVGRRDEREVAVDLDGLARTFTTPRAPAQHADHLLIDDARDHLDAVLAELAAVLLPPPLVSAAMAAAEAGRMLRLAWAPPPSLGSLPIGLLPIGRGRRLLHGAVVTAAPPTSLIAHRGAMEPRSTTTQTTVIIGEGLRFAAEIVGAEGLDLDPSRVLGPPSCVEAEPPLASKLATAEAVRQVLMTPGSGPILYYGHVDPARPGAPLTVRLRLSDGMRPAPLEIGTLLTPQRAGAPEVVVLCGCSSLEPSSIGTGEWWGFGVGLLWQGSHQVIGSMWSPYDCPATALFAVQLVSRLRVGSDPETVLHGLQLEWLEEWEGGAKDSFTGSASDRHPIVWAGWEVTGVQRAAIVG